MEQNNPEIFTKVILAGVDTGEYDIDVSMNELEELALTAKAETVAKITQKRPAFDTATCIGSGRLEEAKELCENLEAELIIFDDELTAVQRKNIEDILGIRAIDRTTLILDIFAQRARTKEGCLQVALAQEKYRLSHLIGTGTQLSRLGGGIGTRGPGESKLETNRRRIRERVAILENELKELKKHRDFIRKRRRKDGILCAAIVGYTNVGKSTLLNALTNSDVLAENKLFATLDITSRGIELPDGRNILIIDTVGLIRRLPHNLVEAFKSTLEEAASADLILNVMDISSPECMEQAEVTAKLLTELGCDGIPKINVLNKCDIAYDENIFHNDDTTVKISAKTGYGFDNLLECIAKNLPETARRMKLLIPYENTSLISKIRVEGKIFEEEYRENGTFIDALVDHRIIHLVKEFEQ
ncbi:MAG: GTPase HflX [Oscillospiraceae bacterium]